MGKPKYRKISWPLTRKGGLEVTKLEVAVTQLETAIKLWFQDGDPASVITLAWAAHEILYQLNKASAHPRESTILEPPDPQTCRGFKIDQRIVDQWPLIGKTTRDFCKHGGTDPNETHDIYPEAIPMVLMDAVYLFDGLNSDIFSPHLAAYRVWTQINVPEIFANSLKQDLGADRAAELVRIAKSMTKQEFLKAVLEAFDANTPIAGLLGLHTPPSN